MTNSCNFPFVSVVLYNLMLLVMHQKQRLTRFISQLCYEYLSFIILVSTMLHLTRMNQFLTMSSTCSWAELAPHVIFKSKTLFTNQYLERNCCLNGCNELSDDSDWVFFFFEQRNTFRVGTHWCKLLQRFQTSCSFYRASSIPGNTVL